MSTANVAAGIQLILRLGKDQVQAAPRQLLEALQRVEIISDAQQGDGFQLNFRLKKTASAEYDLATAPELTPLNRVVIGVLIGSRPQVVMDGVITHHQLIPSSGQEPAILSVTGEDLKVLMSLKPQNQPNTNRLDYQIVEGILAKYEKYGIIGEVKKTSEREEAGRKIQWQTTSDLAYINKLARLNGFVFYIEPVELGKSKAYFGPGRPPQEQDAQPPLTIGLGAGHNIRSIRFSNNPLQIVNPIGHVFKTDGKTVSALAIEGAEQPTPLAKSAVESERSIILRGLGHRDPSRAQRQAQAAMRNREDPIRGDGEVETLRYGHVLRARYTVNVRGAGASYNGLYDVRGVTHVISRGLYTQRFQLSREGLGALKPVVTT